MTNTRSALTKARPQAPGYKVSNAAVARIARAWKAASLAYVDDDAWHEIYDAIQKKDINAAFAALPRISGNDEKSKKLVSRLAPIIMGELGTVFENSANAEYKRVGSSIRAKVKKADEFDQRTRSAGKGQKPFANRFTQVPHGATYLRQRAAQLVVDISESQREAMRTVIATRWDPDARPESLIRDIKWVVGLTDHEAQTVLRREEKLAELGFDDERIRKEIDAFSDKLHDARAERIARTETVFAESEGRQTAWEVAKSEKKIPEDAGKEWVSSYNCCDACKDLDGDVVPIDGEWITDHPARRRTGGRMKGPPLHPNCECMVVLNISDDD